MLCHGLSNNIIISQMAISSRTQLFLLIITYTATIIGVLLWSGSVVEKTLYDKYIIYLEGTLLPTEDIAESTKFYKDVLDFAQVPEKKNIEHPQPAFLITPKKRLILTDRKKNNSAVMLVRVRNGFAKLHKELVKRLGGEVVLAQQKDLLQSLKPRQLTKIFEGPRGRQFIISDPDGNKIIFYKPHRILF